MLKKGLTAVFVCGFCCAGFSETACTVEEMQAKHQAFMNAAIAYAQRQPEQYQEVAQAMATELPELKKLNDLDKLCGFYEEWTGKMQ